MNDLISVILPVYNGEQYIGAALESVLNQTYRDLEIIVIDDCSTDNTAVILNNYHDSRMKILHNEKNSGIVYSLNKGLSAASGQYIARMDADDICMPDRMEKQLQYMKQHPDIIIASCWFEMFGDVNAVVKYPEMHDQIFAELLFGNPFLHPGYFINAEVFTAAHLQYDEKMKLAEDYDLAERASECGKLANVPQILMRYRVHEKQTTQLSRNRQHELGANVRKRLLRKLDINLSKKQEEIFENICFLENYSECCPEKVDEAIKIYLLILNNNQKNHTFNQQYLRRIICKRMYLLLRNSLTSGKITRLQYTYLLLKVPCLRNKLKLYVAQFKK